MTAPTSPAWTLAHVAPATIKAHPDNPRTDVGNVDDLVASIRETGILEPLVVAPPHEGLNARAMGKATHVLIAGHRRLAAAKQAKLATVPVIVRDDLATRAAQVEAMLVENLQRVDLTPVEEADAYQLILDIDGITQKALAEKVSQPVSRIRDRLKLTKISEPIRAKIQAHQITIADALAIAEFDDDPKRQKDLLKHAGAGTDFHWALNRARGEREREQKRAALIEQLTAAGVAVHAAQPKGAKPLSELNLSPGYVSSTNSDVEAQKHATCPGRAAWQTTYGELYFGCTQPALHPKPKVTKTKAEQEREEQEKAARDELAAGLDAATRVRAAFVRDLILKGAPKGSAPNLVVSTRLVALILKALDLGNRYYYGEQLKNAAAFFATVGGTEHPREKGTPDDDYASELIDLIGKLLAGLHEHSLVLALDLATHIGDELYLRKVDLHPMYEYHADWITALTAYGYDWSTFERERFTWTEDVPDGHRVCTVDGPGDIVIDPAHAADGEDDFDDDADEEVGVA